jgi:hypothetical protein
LIWINPSSQRCDLIICFSGETDMNTHRILVASITVTFMAFPAMAQTSSDGGHHYSGGPKTEVPHHMGKKETVGISTTPRRTGGHHYRGGPATSVPHHMGDKQQ